MDRSWYKRKIYVLKQAATLNQAKQLKSRVLIDDIRVNTDGKTYSEI